MYSSMHEGMKETQLGFFVCSFLFFILRIFKNKFLHVTALAEKKNVVYGSSVIFWGLKRKR